MALRTIYLTPELGSRYARVVLCTNVIQGGEGGGGGGGRVGEGEEWEGRGDLKGGGGGRVGEWERGRVGGKRGH